VPVDVRGEHVGPIHRQQVRHQRGVIIEHGGIHAPELITERILEFFGQAAQEHLDVAGDDVRFQRAGGAFRRVHRAEDRMEDVILENFAETFQRPGERHHGKTGKPLVFPQFRLERRQEITRVDQRIVFRFAPRFEQAELDVYRIKKMFERLKIRNFDDIRKRVGVRPRKIAEGERFFP